MKIVSLKSENVKRLSAVEINPDGNMVMIGGENAQGKSSVLDSVFYALAGKSACPAKPIRDGEKKATVEVDLGDKVVRRVITEKTNKVEVVSKDGAKYPSPQKMLDGICGALTFDPLAFANEKPREQAKTLKGLLGLDFTDLDRQRAEIYEQRTFVGREGAQAKGHLEAMVYHDDAPEAEVSVSELMTKLNEAEEKNRNADALRRTAEAANRDVQQAEMEVKDLKKKLFEAEANLKELEADAAKAIEAIKDLSEIDVQPIREEIANADAVNAKVRENRAYEEAKEKRDRLANEWNTLTDKIKAIDNEKAAQIAAAKLPVEGLGFDENGVTYNGLPFSQCSSAEALRVSVAMGIAMNPELRVMFIRDGSLLDENNMKILAEMANDNEMQIWVERVGKADPCAIIIEDGHVAKD
jgi:DNA repair exonuclease SbcCD ATPase subunit